jgi:hypothetical protein
MRRSRFRGMKGRLRRLGSAMLVVAVAASVVAVVALASPAGSQAALVDYFLKIEGVDGESGSGDTQHCGQLDLLCFSFHDTGTATCSTCPPGESSASVDITWTAAAFANNPCKAKSLFGKMKLTWSDSTVSMGTLSGRFIDGKALLSFSGGLDTTSSTLAGATVNGLFSGYTNDLCVARTTAFSGALGITSP